MGRVGAGRVALAPAGAWLAISQEVIAALHRTLRGHYGPQSWWPAGSEWEMMTGAILVQNTAWTNARRALDRLEEAELTTPTALLEVPEDVLADRIRPSGYFNGKARKLKALAALVQDAAGGEVEALLTKPLAELRLLLLGTYGIGPETADAICLYAARHPTAVADGYTRRLFGRLGLPPSGIGYQALYDALMRATPPDHEIHAEFHALVVAHGKQTCLASPRCAECPLLAHCEHGRSTLLLSEAREPQPATADWNA